MRAIEISSMSESSELVGHIDSAHDKQSGYKLRLIPVSSPVLPPSNRSVRKRSMMP